MATIMLSAAGAMLGGGFGGTVLGLSGAVIGRAVGATVGRVIDQRLLGGGSRAVETGRIDRFWLTGASEGSSVARIWGRMRVAGQVIWAGPFEESSTVTRGGKGAPRSSVTEYSYSVSMAVALCEGPILRVGRVWADGEEMDPDDLPMTIHYGTEDQEPDDVIKSYEGADQVPAYRGMAYVVFDTLELAQFGSRVPQFTFEVLRAAPAAEVPGLEALAQGVCLIPGTGEYALATTPVQYDKGMGVIEPSNQHTASARTDMAASLRALSEELPGCGSVSLVVSWFGDDLRCGACQIRPKVESRAVDGNAMPWQVNGIARAEAEELASGSYGPIYGGTPADAAVLEAIAALQEAGQEVMFYPFILMEQQSGNARPDPYGGEEQPVMPWRGRITASMAPGQDGSPVGSDDLRAEVDAFFGTAQASDFSVLDGQVSYGGPEGFGYRRMVLHYAALCAAAGGVSAFCIGSELRGLTTLRAAGDSFPAVAHLRALAAECRAILGPDCKIGYAADWSEYFGYHEPGGDIYFHLDPLWADENIDFIGIDNYLPLSDWRDGSDHLDAQDYARIHDLAYLRGNVCGGEYYDWYYADPAHRAAQIRTPISDGAHGEDWIYRPKDLRGWWGNRHHNRIGGQRQGETAWEPGLKPIWFTELGCAALDKATNQPNKFLDRASSESALPYGSNGQRDDLIQMQYLRAVLSYWGDPAHNPASEAYGGAMVDLRRAHIWAWDSRPFPQFPALSDLWSDAGAYARGHWLNGRAGNQPLAAVVAEICDAAGIAADVSGLYGVVRGYVSDGGETGRAALQPLMLAHGFDAVERGGVLSFRMRGGAAARRLEEGGLALSDQSGGLSRMRAAQSEVAGRVQLSFVEAEGDYQGRMVEALGPDDGLLSVAQSELPMLLTGGEARHLAHRWLAEARLTQESVTLSLPPSQSDLGAGDVIALPAPEGERLYRIDRADQAGAVEIEATRVAPGLYQSSFEAELPASLRSFTPAVPVWPLFLDLPQLRESDTAHAPLLAATAQPWPGSVAVYASVEEAGGYALNRLIGQRAVVGRTLNPLLRARPALPDRGAPLEIELTSGQLSCINDLAFLSGQNLMAIGDGSPDGWELIQFRDAELVQPGRWRISHRLRGQAGTDGMIPDVWPEGAIVVLITAAVTQLDLPLEARDLLRHYRIGPSRRAWDDPSYVARSLAFQGNGLRPYAPCHLRVRAQSDGGLHVSWVRRTRRGGDSWAQSEVPLGESAERYLLRIMRAQTLLEERECGASEALISAADHAAFLADGDYQIAVAQLSETYGPGPFTRIDIHG